MKIQSVTEAMRILARGSTLMLVVAPVVALAAATVLGACASKGPRKPSAAAQAATAEVAASSAQLARFRIRDWSAPNDHMVIVVADDGTRYRAETMGPCQGLDFANQVQFVNRGGFQQIDRFSSIQLVDGTRCSFQSFDKLKAPATSALDQYEKAGEAKPAEKPAEPEGEAKPKS